MDKFTAHVQDDDWSGSVAADEQPGSGIVPMLVSLGMLNPDIEFVASISLRVSTDEGKLRTIVLTASIAKQPKKTPWGPVIAAQTRPLQVRIVELDASTLESFFCLFKRSEVVLTQRGLKLDGRSFIEFVPFSPASE